MSNNIASGRCPGSVVTRSPTVAGHPLGRRGELLRRLPGAGPGLSGRASAWAERGRAGESQAEQGLGRAGPSRVRRAGKGREGPGGAGQTISLI